MILIDVHCHLDHERYVDKLDAVLKRCEDAGVKVIVSQGVNVESSKRILEIAKKSPIVKLAFGLYPSEATNVRVHDDYIRESTISVDDTIAFIRSHKKDIVAIGEVGIDLQESDDKETQVENFKKIIALAKELEKPLIIHTRKAEQLVIDTLEESGISHKLVLFHCFCGKKKLVERAVKLKYSFSIPCNITRAENFQMMVEMIPITQLFTETDGPYMPPDKEMEFSESRHVANTVKIIAQIKGMSTQEVADSIFMNYQRMFL